LYDCLYVVKIQNSKDFRTYRISLQKSFIILKKQKLKPFFKKPYPFNSDLIHNAKIIFLISIVIGLFLFFFQPFGMDILPGKNIFTISALVSLITFAILGFNLLVLPSYFTTIFDNEKWIILKEIIWNFWLFATLIGGYFIYFTYAKLNYFNSLEMAKVVLLSLVPIAILVVLNQNRLLKINLNDAIELNKKILSKMNSGDDTILFESEYKNDSISLKANIILAIKSANNYIEIFWKDKNKINKHLIRLKLQKAEELLKPYNFIYKCHRAFLININYIKQANGTTQGLNLVLDYLDFEIPVSRTFVNKLKEII